MKTCGIVAEYNPFHYGHKWQIEQARKLSGADLIIAVMSGNFVQRGEPAVLDKWKRAECALRNGVDVVIELPYIYATQSASHFARGAVELLKLAGVDAICFGSECGNLENLQEIADTPVNPDHLHAAMGNGLSFPRAYSLLTSSMAPNDILAVSYLKALKDTGITPIPVQRTTGYLDDAMGHIASAYAIRKALHDHKDLSDSTPMEQTLLDAEIPWPENYYPYLRTFLLTSHKEELERLFLFSEGIENHLVSHAKDCDSYDDFLDACTNYRYTSGRIRRSCLQAVNQVTKEEVKRLPKMDALRILGFNDNGRQWLHDLRKKDVRVASRFADVPYPWRVIEYRTSLLYTSVLSKEKRKEILDNEIRGAHYVKTSA